jgi:hypothetical protein
MAGLFQVRDNCLNLFGEGASGPHEASPAQRTEGAPDQAWIEGQYSAGVVPKVEKGEKRLGGAFSVPVTACQRSVQGGFDVVPPNWPSGGDALRGQETLKHPQDQVGQRLLFEERSKGSSILPSSPHLRSYVSPRHSFEPFEQVSIEGD